jgi:hypothetical protein
MVARLEQLEQLGRLVFEVDPFERRARRVPAPDRDDEREPVRQRLLGAPRPPAGGDAAVEEDEAGPRAEGLDVPQSRA